MSDNNKHALEIMKFVFSVVISVLIAALGYMMTKKLEAIEGQLNRMNNAINQQMVINNTLEFKIEILGRKVEVLEEKVGM